MSSGDGLTLLIRNGRVFDGSNGNTAIASVGIRADRIVALGVLPDSTVADVVIDAAGALVCPGFIDIHTHSDLSVLSQPDCHSKLFQGVTTEVVGNCSFSAFPSDSLRMHEHNDLLRMIGPVDIPVRWFDLDGYAEAVKAASPCINVAPLVGHGTLRVAAGIGANAKPTPSQTKRMHDLLHEAFHQGAFGFSTGLTYLPSSVADDSEIDDLLRITAMHDRLYATHSRSGHVTEFDAFHEVANATTRAGTRLQYSHLALNQPSNWGKAGEMLDIIHRARDSGIDVAFDVYPYDASSSALIQYLPDWIQKGGYEAMIERLAQPGNRAQVEFEMRRGWWCGAEGPWQWNRFIISAAPAGSPFVGRTIADVAREAGESGERTALRLCELSGNDIHVVLHYRKESDVIEFLSDDLACIGSDGLALSPGCNAGLPHPRSFGCFPRVLGRYVREHRALPLADALRKMTSAPADRLRLFGRGRLFIGGMADVVIFDPNQVVDRATFVSPLRLSEGIRTVIVNGQIVLQEGRLTGHRPGKLLRREA